MHRTYHKTTLLKQRARNLRSNSSEAEKRIWYHLRNRRLQGYKFLRQYTIGSYIVDFICREKQLIIEVDGGQHYEQSAYDAKRTVYLEANGFKVMRFWNDEVLKNTEVVLELILGALLKIVP
ncbi:endonuclease domain-containing protein [soil metagenome]